MAIEECASLPTYDAEQQSYNGQRCTVEIFSPDEYTTDEFWFDPAGQLVFHREIMSAEGTDESLEVTHEIDTIDTDVDTDLLDQDLSGYTISKGTVSQ